MRDGPLLIVDCDPGHDDALALGLAHVPLGWPHCWAVLLRYTVAKLVL